MTGYHSFPSGHTITIFAMITVVILVLVPKIQSKTHLSLIVGCFSFASLVAISRVAVGVHWPLDLVAGATLGHLAGMSGVMLTQRYQYWWSWLDGKKYQFIFGSIMFVWSCGLFKRVFKHSDNTDIIIWVAASIGLITSLFILKNTTQYYFQKSSSLSST